MKISSRSILSPGRVTSGRDPQPISLSTSLSRRLKTSRSIRGATSPAMFPALTTGKKRGCGFDNPEPTSPKVTCIGQVRVKNKKKHSKNVPTLSKRRNTTFSKLEHSCSQRIDTNNTNNQKWVHLPLTICEALRAFGSEVSCLFPCRSSCSSSIEKEEKMGSRQGTCAVFARWLVDLNENDNDNENENEENGIIRRHVFEDLEIVNDNVIGSRDEGRVSICVPPKNALLLMRCRSDPMKMEALANRFWGSNLDRNDDENVVVLDEVVDQEIVEMEAKECFRQENVEMKESVFEEKPSIEGDDDEESMFIWSLFEEIEENEVQLEMVDALEEFFDDENFQEIETGESKLGKVKQEIETEESKIEKVKGFEEGIEDMVTDIETHEEIVMELEEENGVLVRENAERETTSKELPECLLLMLYEPKLSMEVSKETWVCSSDFIRRRKKPPPLSRMVKSNECQDESKVNVITTKECDNHLMKMSGVQFEPGLNQPARSSCSLPKPRSTVSMLEQKFVDTIGYEPLMLKRCKSEPMRNKAANLAPETCLWINKLEPPRRASFHVGTVGLGF